jgi:glutaredoxin
MNVIRWLVGKIILALDRIFAPVPAARGEEEQRRVDDALAGLALYQYEACPFCVKVRRFLRASGASLPLRDAKAEPCRAELLRGGGKLQVPCLRVENGGDVRWLYESGDIIAFLKERIERAGAR